MGVDFHAIAGIGIKVEREKLFTKKKVKAFDHNFTEDFQFDPKTGKELWDDEDIPIKEYDPDDEKFFGYPAKTGTCDDYVYIFVKCSRTKSHRSGGSYYDDFARLPDDSSIDEFKKCMKQIGVWNDKFGLWAVSDIG